MRYQDVHDALADTGFLCRGGFRPNADDRVPGIGDHDAAVVVIVGNGGPEMWRHFAAARSTEQRRDDANPLNDWSAAVLRPIAERLGARVLFPFDRPYLPFQRWAVRADTVWPTPIGPLIHPEFGLWHAYRAALVFTPGFPLPPRVEAVNPCTTCPDRPCLSACPVGAYSANGYDVPACIDHISTKAGRECMDFHCGARRACPVGTDRTYEPAQSAFHMARFRASNSGRPETATSG